MISGALTVKNRLEARGGKGGGIKTSGNVPVCRALIIACRCQFSFSCRCYVSYSFRSLFHYSIAGYSFNL